MYVRNSVLHLLSFCLIVFMVSGILSGCTSGSRHKERPITHGLWLSRDGGKTWKYSSTSEREQITEGKFPAIDIYGFINDPYTPGIVYALSNYGVWRTIDRGETWTQLVNGLKRIGEQAIVTSLVFDRNNTNRFFVGGTFTPSTGKVFVTEDGGESWQQIYQELKNNIPIVGLGIDNTNPDFVYVMSQDLGFKESFDGGKTWKRVRWLSDEIEELSNKATAIDFWVNPLTANEMVVLTSAGVYQSLDRGKTWQARNEGITGRLSTRSTKETLLPMTSFLPIPERNTYFVGTQQGVFQSTNKGKTWENMTKLLPVRIPLIDVMSYDASDPETLYFAAESIAVYQTHNGGISWDSADIILEEGSGDNIVRKIVSPNRAAALFVDHVDPDTIYLGVKFISSS